MSLYDPIELPCGLVVPGRVALAPLTNLQSEADGCLSAAELEWLRRRAAGGFSWLSTCATYVCDEGKAWPGQLGAADERHLPGLTTLATTLKREGVSPFVQLHHGGPQAALAPGLPLGAVTIEGKQRGASLEELLDISRYFAQAAERVERAGFDGVELHGANGYLFTHFLSPVENTREDEYGVALAGRARLLYDTMRAVRAQVSPRFAVGVRLSPIDLWAPRGLVLEDSIEVALNLVALGCDFIHLSLMDVLCHPPGASQGGASVVRAFRDALPSHVPLLAAGGIWSGDDARRALDEGLDVVVLGRAAIAHPDWPQRVDEPGWTPKRPPYTRSFLASGGASSPLLDYLARRPGMIEDGQTAR